MYLTQEEKDFLIRLGARINGTDVYDQNGNKATDDDIKGILEEAKRQGQIGGSRAGDGGSSGRRGLRRNIIDADARIIDDDADDSEEGYENQRQYRRARGSNRQHAHRSGYSAPQTRSEAEDVDMGYIPTARENRTARAKLNKEQRAAKREERGQKQRKIRQYAVNEMKYGGRITFLNKKTESARDTKQWCAFEYNPETGKGLTVEVCSSRDEAKRVAERMLARHGRNGKYVQKIAFTEPANIKSNGSFKKKPSTVYKVEPVR